MALEYNINLDMDKSDRSPEMVAARVGDHDSVKITASLTNKGAAYTPQGTNAYFECVTSAGTSVRIPATKSTSSVSVLIPMAALVAPGVITCAYFRFESGTTASPSYVESTQSFGIIVPDAIDDNIVPEDYIAEWRQLQAQLEQYVDQVEAAATQAKSDIAEQKEEVDDLKSQAQTAIAQDTVAVENAKTQAISDINATKAEVADAAKDVTAAGDKAISQFKTNSQQAINSFNTNGTSAISQFNTNANGKLDEVDDMITEAQGDVDAKISQLETATDQAVSAMEDALDGTTAGSLQNAINRTLKLDVADMTNIPNNASLSSYTNVGSYCCKTAAIAATISDCPIDDSPFNMYVFSSATSGQVMQLVVPIDLNGKPTAEWHVRFGTSSAMDKWSVVGGGADISAGLGIDVTGDAQKTVSLDTTAFYQHHEATDIIQGSTEVTGGGRIKKLTVYGNTRQNLWVNPSWTQNGVTVTRNDDGSLTVAGTNTAQSTVYIGVSCYALRDGATYTASIDKKPVGFNLSADYYNKDGYVGTAFNIFPSKATKVKFTVDFGEATSLSFFVVVEPGTTVSGTYRVMLNEGSEAEPWCPPGLNSVDELSVVCAGKNLLPIRNDVRAVTNNGITFTPNPDGTVNVNGTSTANDNDYYMVGRAWSDRAKYTLASEGGLVFSSNGRAKLYGYDRDGSLVTSSMLNNSHVLIPSEDMNSVVEMIVYLSYANGQGETNKDVYVQLELGSTATAYEPPNITTTPIDLQGHTLNSLPDGTCDELTIDATGAVTLTKRVGAKVLPSDAASWKKDASGAALRYSTGISPDAVRNYVPGTVMSDALPPRVATDDAYGSTCIIAALENAYASIGSGETAQTIASVCGGKTLLYALATPQEIDLPGITMPKLASPEYIVFATSSVPAEIEADVVKVDYLHPSDVYTKEEVDQKIEDVGSMPDIVPVSQGGTGVTTAAAERNRLGLGNTTGAVPVANGGTGATTNKAAMYNVTSGMAEGTSVPADDTTVVFAYSSPSSDNGGIYKRKLQYVWNYIVTKIRSVFGFDSSNVLDIEHGGTGFNDFPAMLVNLGSTSTASPYQAAPRPGVTGTLPVTRGGTGATSAADARTNIAAAYGISSVQGSLSDSTKVTSDLSSSTNKNFTLSSLWNGWLEDKISTFLGSYGTFKKIYQNSDQSMTAQSNAVLQAFQNGKLLILVCRLYVPSYTTVTDYNSGTKTWTGPTFPSEIPTAMVPTSVLSDWNTLSPIYEFGCYSAGGSSNWNNRKVLQQVKLASSGRGLTGAVNTFDAVATNKTPVQVWVNAYMFLAE